VERLQYRELKEVVADALVELTGHLRARRAEILQDVPAVNLQVKEMSDKARSIASETIKDVRAIIGLPERT
jgi:hypothetical protein